MPIFNSDFFSGAGNVPLENHTANAGGQWLKHPVYTSASILSGGQGTHAKDTNQNLYYLPSTAPTPSYTVQITIDGTNAATADYIGVAAHVDPTLNTNLLLRFEPQTNALTYYEENNNSITNSSSGAFTLVAATLYTLRLEIIGTLANAYVNGVFQFNGAISTNFAPGHAGIQSKRHTLIGAMPDITDFQAATSSCPPTLRYIAILQPSNITAIYTPTNGIILSNLTFWATPRNIVLKGPAADQAWEYIQSVTPRDMIVGA